jgi:peptide/nickel transport system substrate-binding protein
MLTRRRTMATAAALPLLGRALPASAQAPASPGGRLVVATQSSPRSLEPTREFSNVSWRIGYNVFEGLIRVDYKNEFKLVPGLAQSWRRLSPTVLELTLKDGVRFHDASVLTAEDVAFSFGPERMQGEGAPGRAISRIFVGTVQRVDALDARTVRVTTHAPDPLLEQRLAGWAGQIISKRAWLAAASFEAWERAPVGTGPYKVREFRIDQRCVLEAHAAYHGGVVPAREIVFEVRPELASRIAALATGEVDLITEMSVDQVGEVARLPGRDVVGGPILNLRVLVFDQNHPVLADARVRRALALAIDRRAIVDGLYGGRTRVADTYQHAVFGALNDPGRAGHRFDPDAARRLLREAGYAGQPIPYRTHQGYYAQQAQTAQVLAEMWKQVGLNVELQFRENWTQILEPGPTRAIRDWSNSILFGDPAGGLGRLFGPRGPVQGGYREWTNARFNSLATTLETSVEPDQRRAAFQRMLDIWESTDPPGTTLHELVMLYGKKSSIDWTPYPVEYMDFGPGNLAFRQT